MSLEEAQPWLPQVRLNRRELLKGAGLGRFSQYYAIAFGTSGAIATMGGVLSLIQCYPNNNLVFSIIPVNILILLYLESKMLHDTQSTKAYECEIRVKRTMAYQKYEQYREIVTSGDLLKSNNSDTNE